MVMTPFKPKQRFVDYGDEPMVPSPPRESTLQKLPSANLFGDGVDTNSPKNQSRRRVTLRKKTPSSSDERSNVLRPINLNSFTPGGSKHRKRPSDYTYPIGRRGLFDDGDEDMFLSPRPSPRISPNAYRTLDGRTVTSKNPFSPYTPAEESMGEADSYSPTLMRQSVPAFPDGPTASNASIMLPQRTKQSTPFKQTYFGPSGTGFPDQEGQYSFTGSPIEEIDNTFLQPYTEVRSKVRRLHLQDNASRRTPYIDTRRGSEDSLDEKTSKVSPTDVISFPFPSTPALPAPMNTDFFYAQLRTTTGSGPPPTPAPKRHHSREEEEEEEEVCLKPKSRFNQDFDVIDQLGNGSFGTVYKCLSRLDGCMYAVKAAKRKAKGAADRDRMLKEVYALAALSDQADTAAFHIVRYHQAWMEENRLYIQIELCSFTLDTEIKKGALSVKRRYKLLREILLALGFIHRNSMVHLDIKPENIFVKNDQYKLGDFGLVSKVGYNKDVEEGDSRYMSMELLNAGNCDDLTKNDIFSMGVTMYQICSGRDLPMNGQEWQDIRSCVLKPFQDTPLEMEMIVKEMMNPQPSKRPKPSELLKNNELLSEEQKQLLIEKRKVMEVNLALALQTERMKKISPRRPTFARANTWNGSVGLPRFL